MARPHGARDVSNVLRDGSKWGLKLLMTGRGTGGDDALPFVVEDVEGRGFRIPAYQPHANGVTAVDRVRIASSDPAATASRLALILGLGPAVPASKSGRAFGHDARQRRKRDRNL